MASEDNFSINTIKNHVWAKYTAGFDIFGHLNQKHLSKMFKMYWYNFFCNALLYHTENRYKSQYAKPRPKYTKTFATTAS